jgi:hypothetical protein
VCAYEGETETEILLQKERVRGGKWEERKRKVDRVSAWVNMSECV